MLVRCLSLRPTTVPTTTLSYSPAETTSCVRSLHSGRVSPAKKVTSSDLFGLAFDTKEEEAKVPEEKPEGEKEVETPVIAPLRAAADILKGKEAEEAAAARTTAKARRTNVGASMQKMKEVCRQVRRMHVNDALDQLYLNNRRVARDVYKTVKQARNNALHLGLDADNLVISRYAIGRGTPLKRMDPKARGRGAEAIRALPKSHLEVEVALYDSVHGKVWDNIKRKKELTMRYKKWKKPEKYGSQKVAEE